MEGRRQEVKASVRRIFQGEEGVRAKVERCGGGTRGASSEGWGPH